MNVTQLEWIVTLGVTIAVLLFDIIVIARRPHEPTTKECAIALTFVVDWMRETRRSEWLIQRGRHVSNDVRRRWDCNCRCLP